MMMMMTMAVTVVNITINCLLNHSFCTEHSVQIQKQIYQCCFTGFLSKICIIRKWGLFLGKCTRIRLFWPFCQKGLLSRNDFFFLIIKVQFTSLKHTILVILKYAIQWILGHSKCTTLTTVKFRNIFTIPKGNLVPIKHPSPCPSHHSPRQTLGFFCHSGFACSEYFI